MFLLETQHAADEVQTPSGPPAARSSGGAGVTTLARRATAGPAAQSIEHTRQSIQARSPFVVQTLCLPPFVLYHENRPDAQAWVDDAGLHYRQSGSGHPPTDREARMGLCLDITVDRGGNITIVTEPMNIRPVFYRTDGSAFSSHPAFLNPRGLDAEVLTFHLLLSYNPLFGRTLFPNLRQTLPGRIHSFADGTCRLTQTPESLDHLFPSSEGFDEETFYRELDARLRSAVADALRDQPEVHLQLSGGVDTRGLLSEVYRQTQGPVHSHGYGPEWFTDNFLARQIEARLPRLTHHVYSFHEGSDLVDLADDVVFHARASTRVDDVFRNLVLSADMGSPGVPLLGALGADSLLGDESEPWMSTERPFADTDPQHLIHFLSYFDRKRATAALDPTVVLQMRESLRAHYVSHLPTGLSELDGYDLLNMLVRHGRGTMGSFWGTEVHRTLVVPGFHRDVFRLAFTMPRRLRYLARGYLSYLKERCFDPVLADLPTTRDITEELRRATAKPAGPNDGGALRAILPGMARDYYFAFYEKNEVFRTFVADHVCAFDRRGLVPARYVPLLADTEATRILITVALMNRALELL